MKEFSIYNSKLGIKQVKPTGTINLGECADLIRGDERLMRMTSELRGIKNAAAKQKYKLLLPYVIFAGTFTKRANDDLIKRSEFFMIDLDKGIEDIEKTKFAIWDAHKPALMFISPRGGGLKVVFRIDPSDGEHEEFFVALQNFFRNEIGMEIDRKCKDVSRASFLCHDSKVFLFEGSAIFPLTDEQTRYNDAIKWTDEQETFTEGNRNQYITTLAGRCHRFGISKKFVQNQLAEFTEDGFTLDGIQNTIKSIYSNAAYAGTADLSKAIVCSVGEIDRIIKETEAVLLEASPHEIFKRDGEVVWVDEDEGSAKIKLVDYHQLNRIFSKYIKFAKKTPKRAKTRIDPPPNLAITYLKSGGALRLASLAGLIYAPTIRKDGSILDHPGYDEQSGLFLVNNAEFLPVPAEPTREDALEGLKIFDPILFNFDFETPADRSVFLAAALTGLVRQNFIEAPLFGISAPIIGSGKTLLSNIIHLIATGKYVRPMSEGASDEESDKQIYATLREGNPIILIDNVKNAVESKALCSIITASDGIFRGRVLGKSEMVEVNAMVTFLVTGNNLTINSEMTRRVLMSTIDPKCDDPENRPNKDFKIPKLVEHIKKHRAEIVQALLTMIKAYWEAGCPGQDMTDWGGFENFSQWIRGPLVWVGCVDPYETTTKIKENDPEREWQQKLKVNWLEIFKDESIKVSKVTDKCIQYMDTDDPACELAEAFMMATGSHYPPDSRAIGKILSQIKGKVIDGYKFVRSDTRNKGTFNWRLMKIVDPLLM